MNWDEQIKKIWQDPITKQIILYGNVEDLKLWLVDGKKTVGNKEQYLLEVLLESWEWVLHLDPALGWRVIRGDFKITETGDHYKAIEILRNQALIEGKSLAVVVSNAAQFIGPTSITAPLLVKRWALSHQLREQKFTVIGLAEGLLELHSVVKQVPQVNRIEIGYPEIAEIEELLEYLGEKTGNKLEGNNILQASTILQGISLNSLYTLFLQNTKGVSLQDAEKIKRESVEINSEGYLEFLKDSGGLDTLYGQEELKAVLRRDIRLWNEGHFNQMPKGYLMAGPVGTGKTFTVEALASEAKVPVLKINNFRGGGTGETEARLEKIFRQIHSLPRCYVFIDEADQMMGERKSGSEDGGLSGRIYAMFAQEIASERNRGRIVWIFATSQPQKLEPDLKRPGRVDLKIPLLPCESKEATWKMLVAMGVHWKLELALPKVNSGDFSLAQKVAADEKYILNALPEWVTPAAASVILGDIYRKKQEGGKGDDRDLLMDRLREYRPPISPKIMQEQTRLAVRECSDVRFIPKEFKYLIEVEKPYAVL